MPTLYLTDPTLRVNVSSEHLEVFERNGSTVALKRRIPLFDVDRVAVTARAHLSAGALYQLLKRQIPVSLITRRGRLVGAFTPHRDGDAGLRIRQYERSRDATWGLTNAQALVRAKLLNGRRLLQKTSADKEIPGRTDLEEALEGLQALAEKTLRAETADEARGFEGAGSALYFRELRHLFPHDMPFTGRSRRPPKDPVNALLSWTYTLVLSELKTAVAESARDYVEALQGGRAVKPFLMP